MFWRCVGFASFKLSRLCYYNGFFVLVHYIVVHYVSLANRTFTLFCYSLLAAYLVQFTMFLYCVEFAVFELSRLRYNNSYIALVNCIAFSNTGFGAFNFHDILLL
jgi:hypothetical protein